MIKRSYILLFVLLTLFTSIDSCLMAVEPNNVSTASSTSSIDKYNQMMLVLVERLKGGNTKEARKIANDLIAFSKKYKDDAKTEYKSFYSEIEKEVYIMQNPDNKKKVVWVEEPIADGYYFLAVIDFYEKRFKEAIEDIQKCIFWNPVRSPYYCERGFIFLNSGYNSDIISAQVAYEAALEYADNEEDFASALRGLGFVFSEKNQFEESYAAMVLSKEFVRDNVDADDQILYLKQLIPNFDFKMDANRARKILKDSKIQTTYSPIHAKVLMKIASGLKKPEEKDKAIIFLTQALMLEPQNAEVTKMLKALKGKK